jgi:hypothetical protein
MESRPVARLLVVKVSDGSRLWRPRAVSTFLGCDLRPTTVFHHLGLVGRAVRKCLRVIRVAQVSGMGQ